MWGSDRMKRAQRHSKKHSAQTLDQALTHGLFAAVLLEESGLLLQGCLAWLLLDHHPSLDVFSQLLEVVQQICGFLVSLSC